MNKYTFFIICLVLTWFYYDILDTGVPQLLAGLIILTELVKHEESNI